MAPTVICEGDVVLHKGLKVLPMGLHVLDRLLAQVNVSPGVALQLVPQSSEQTVPAWGGGVTCINALQTQDRLL